MTEDPKEKDLLYAGTEVGVFASFDRGASWTDLRLGLPSLAVVDIKVHPRDNDVVIATHARGFYILDDATPLQRVAEARGRMLTLFAPMPAIRYTPASDTSVLGNRAWVARNQPYGALLSYYVEAGAREGEARIQVLDAEGRVVRAFTGPARAGINRAVWDLSEDSSCSASTPTRGRRGGGGWLRALPGDYTVRLTLAGETVEQPLRVRLDPRVTASAEDLRLWYREARKIESMECRVDQAVARARGLDSRLGEVERSAGALAAEAAAVRNELRTILAGDPRDPAHVNLQGRINWLTIQVGNYSGRPTAAQMEWIATFASQADALLRRLDRIVQNAVASLNTKLRSAGLPEIS